MQLQLDQKIERSIMKIHIWQEIFLQLFQVALLWPLGCDFLGRIRHLLALLDDDFLPWKCYSGSHEEEEDWEGPLPEEHPDRRWSRMLVPDPLLYTKPTILLGRHFFGSWGWSKGLKALSATEQSHATVCCIVLPRSSTGALIYWKVLRKFRLKRWIPVIRSASQKIVPSR